MHRRILFYSLCSCIFLVAGACATLGGYTVEPVTTDQDTGTPLESVLIGFWDLPPGIMLLSLAISSTSVVGFAVDLFIYIKLFLYLGYRKISRNTLFHNAVRSRIYSCIKDNPGIFFNALVRTTDVKRGTLRYHLIVLKMMGKIAVLDSTGNPRYFDNSGRYSEIERHVLKFLRNDTDYRICRLLLESTDVTRKELADRLGLSLSTVSWRMKRLSKENIIRIQKMGKNVHYEINPDAWMYLKKYLDFSQDITNMPCSVS